MIGLERLLIPPAAGGIPTVLGDRRSLAHFTHRLTTAGRDAHYDQEIVMETRDTRFLPKHHVLMMLGTQSLLMRVSHRFDHVPGTPRLKRRRQRRR